MNWLQFFVIAIIIALSFYAVVLLLSWCGQIPAQVRRMKQSRQKKRIQRSLYQSFVLLAHMRWGEAERVLIRYARKSDYPALHYVLAALAASKQHENRRVDHYLRLAGSTGGGFAIESLLLWQAQLGIWRDDAIEAIATLEKLKQRTPKQPLVNRLLLDVYVNQRNWEKAQIQLKHVRKHKLIDTDTLQHLSQKCARGAIDDALHDSKQLPSLWENIQRMQRDNQCDDDIVFRYVQALIQGGHSEQARDVLHETLMRKGSDEKLFVLYASLPVEADTLYTHAKYLWEKHQSTVSRLCFAQLSMRTGRFDEAVKHLEIVVRDRPDNRHAWWLLADVFYKRDEHDNALRCYREITRLDNMDAGNDRHSFLSFPERKTDNTRVLSHVHSSKEGNAQEK